MTSAQRSDRLGTEIQLLQDMSLFGAIRDDALQFLLARAHRVNVAAGGYFFEEGDIGLGMYVLQSGCAAVLRQWQGQPFELRRLVRGDCFGEMALIDLMPRSASVKAVEDCSALELRPEDLHALFEFDVEQFALIQMNMAREISRRLRELAELMFRQQAPQVGGRASDVLTSS
jgi:CRP-like cAMP-binding protein